MKLNFHSQISVLFWLKKKKKKNKNICSILCWNQINNHLDLLLVVLMYEPACVLIWIRQILSGFTGPSQDPRQFSGRSLQWIVFRMMPGLSKSICDVSRLRDCWALHRGRSSLRSVPAAGLSERTIPDRAAPPEDRGPQHSGPGNLLPRGSQSPTYWSINPIDESL